MTAACATPPPPPPAPPVITFEQKMAWILQLEDQRVLRLAGAASAQAPAAVPAQGRIQLAPAPPPTPDLLRLLDDAEARVRRRAALGVGRVGLADGVGPLAKLLADPEPDVRQMAAFGLGLIGDGSAVDALVRALADEAPLVEGRAAEALGLIGDARAAPAVAKMAAAHVAAGALTKIGPDDTGEQDPGAEAFRLGVFALVRLRSYDALASAVLTADGKPVTMWWPVAFGLQRIEDARAAPALLQLLRAPGSYTRSFAARGLGGLKDRSATPLLVPLVTGWRSQPQVAVSATRALGQIGDPSAAAVLDKLVRAPDTDPNLRVEIVNALGAMRASDASPLLIDLISDPWPTMRAAALAALRQVDPDNFVLVLSGLDPDPNWSVRVALATVLQSLEAEVSVPRLEQLLDDPDQRVVPPVLNAMTRVKAPGVEKILMDRLQHDDPIVRASVASNLGELKPAGGAEALATAYKTWQKDTTYVARAAALAALAKYGREAAAPVLQAALGDRDWAVRVRAASLLKALDPSANPADAMRPAPDLRATLSYQAPEMVTPTVSPHAFIETDRGTIEIELAVLDAPQTTRSFSALARKGFFNGVSLHRVVPNFVVQGGDPRGDGDGGPGYTIRDELNMRPYVRGTVGMALDWRDTGGSQFFITHSPQPHLDARYTVFGHVVAGIEVVDVLRQWDVIRRVRVWDGKEMTEK
ncbi:MAG: HEAT repeat domain-containing protein [Acidobacteria bacterium]|nr:HEAT repeat domain-containing protein [Acidobacteriota bacterium]